LPTNALKKTLGSTVICMDFSALEILIL